MARPPHRWPDRSRRYSAARHRSARPLVLAARQTVAGCLAQPLVAAGTAAAAARPRSRRRRRRAWGGAGWLARNRARRWHSPRHSHWRAAGVITTSWTRRIRAHPFEFGLIGLLIVGLGLR